MTVLPPDDASSPAPSSALPPAPVPSPAPPPVSARPSSLLNPDEGVEETLYPIRLSAPAEKQATAYALYSEAVSREADAGLPAAIPLYRAALKQDPSYVPLYLKVTLALLTDRRFAEADTLLTQGLAANPDSPSLLASLALTREYEGQPAEALRLAAKAKDLAPAHLLAHRVAFETLRNQKKDAEALRLIRAASAVPVEKIPRAQDWAALARLYTELEASLNSPPPLLVNSIASKNKTSPIREQLADLILPFYEKAFAAGPPTRDLLRQRGEFAIYLDRKEEAYGYLKRASQIDDSSVEIYITLAGLCSDLGKNGEAIDNYEKAYALQPDFPELWKVLAHLYVTPEAPNLKMTDKAIDLLEDVLRRNPTELEAAVALGDLDIETNQLEKAELNLRQALILSLASPKTASPLFHLKLALLLMRENRMEETAALLREAEQRFPQSARIPFLEGIIARNLKQPKEAIDFFAKARIMAKDQEADLLNGEFYCELSIAQEQAGQIAQSEETLRQGLVVEPENPNLLNALAYLWAEQNRNLNDALKYSRRSIELKPGQGEYMDTLGWIEYRLGQYAEAAANLQKAAEITGNDATVLNHLADTLAKLGKADDARKVLQKILSKEPDNAEARKKLGN
ncbi:Tetratricopeptide repeat-containing protein [Verrucomicrobium sp. GAS474]|uniref:tetratricopeptide repeat protein n=1 Tax=Verrucomicrobium sp. GAS474 TaxID=1882831 RepID=UPI000879CF5B|nr:tetratricopeptide repeat protein [Verrucomicrobium sp. GAS474]SDU16641.1 Tetratricopeptide repeat-containing protein [Verrucomicrobium sp. GAS474]